MCFSATASFAASAAMSVVGIASIRSVKRREELPLACIPFLFAIQQFLEGVLWLTLDQPLASCIATKGFLSFAYVVWPLLMPIAAYLIEPSLRQKARMFPIMVLGWVVAGIGLASLIWTETTVVVHGHSLAYTLPMLYWLYIPLYVLVVCVSSLFSSYRWVTAFGIGLFLSLVLALTISFATSASVWCFFAAILSGFIFLHFQQGRPLYLTPTKLPKSKNRA